MKRLIIAVLMPLITFAVCSADEVVIWNGQTEYFVDVSTEGQLDMLQRLSDLYAQCDIILQTPPSNSAQCEVLINLKEHINAIVNRLDNEKLQIINVAWNEDINTYLIRCAQIKSVSREASRAEKGTQVQIRINAPIAKKAKKRSSEFYPGIVGGGAINPKTGEFYPGIVGGGAINPKTGEVYPGVPGGAINP